MTIFKDFRDFAMRGNVIDLAVGVVIGAAFGKIVTSLVNDLIMPPLGLIVGGDHFKNLKVVLRQDVIGPDGKVADVTWNYGAFIQNVLDFLIIAFAIFLLVKFIKRFRKKEEEKPKVEPVPTREEILLTEIRDALRAKQNF